MIHYRTGNEAVETFTNFHLETYFNNSLLTESVGGAIMEQIAKHRNEDGFYDITSGYYVYSFIKK